MCSRPCLAIGALKFVKRIYPQLVALRLHLAVSLAEAFGYRSVRRLQMRCVVEVRTIFMSKMMMMAMSATSYYPLSHAPLAVPPRSLTPATATLDQPLRRHVGGYCALRWMQTISRPARTLRMLGCGQLSCVVHHSQQHLGVTDSSYLKITFLYYRASNRRVLMSARPLCGQNSQLLVRS